MIKLYIFGPAFGLPDASPFCLKVDFYLRAAGLEYETHSGIQHLRRSPKGKLPFIEDGGTVVPDSAFIINYLKAEYGDPLDAGLTAGQRAAAHAFIRMMEENLYWCIVHFRWLDDAGWAITRRQFFGGLPFPVRQIVPALLRRRIRQTLHGQGLGRHGADEIAGIGRRDLQALSDCLAEKDYFFGNHLTTLDVVAWAFLAEIIVPPFENALQEAAKSFPNLVAFVERLRAKYYA
jgi:glutathione S-transferase